MRLLRLLTIRGISMLLMLIVYSEALYADAITVFEYPGAAQTEAMGINNKGQIVGTYLSYVNPNGAYQGFFRLANGNQFTLPDIQSSSFEFASSINDTGQIVGYYNSFNGFLYSGGAFSIFVYPGASVTVPQGINDQGEISGWYFNGENQGFIRYPDGTFQSIDYPGSDRTIAEGINSFGDVVGYYVDGAGHFHGFIYNSAQGVYSSFDIPTGQRLIQPNDINDEGQIVGWYEATNGAEHPFLRNPDGSVTAYDNAYGFGGINDQGIIVGTYDSVTGFEAFEAPASAIPLAPVPEPSALLLLATVGLALMLFTRPIRRRSRR